MPTVPPLPPELYFIGPPRWNEQLSSWWVTRYAGVHEVLTAPGLSAEYVPAAEREQHTPLMSGPQAADGERTGGCAPPSPTGSVPPRWTGFVP